MKTADRPQPERQPGILHRLSLLLIIGGLVIGWAMDLEGGGTMMIAGVILGFIDSVRRKDFPRNDFGGP